MPSEKESPFKIHLVSLGCDKNLVDSEIMLGLLTESGYELAFEPEQADVIIVNTCGFIRKAVRESVRVLLEMSACCDRSRDCDHDRVGRRVLIVTGCMAQRYQEEIFQEIPEVDAIVGVEDFHHIGEVIRRTLSGEKVALFNAPLASTASTASSAPQKRIVSTPGGFAYLKIAEGCDNRCTYCAIPSIKGSYRSRTMDSLIAETRTLTASGVREVILVAQDTALYGQDLGQDPSGRPNLAELLRRLAQIEELIWIRILYAYPENITGELIAEMASNPKVCHYIDMPAQHINGGVLKRMGRKAGADLIRALLAKLRDAMPDIALRTTLMTGFPGETEEEFQDLLAFLPEARFDRLGVFTYSREEGTPAYQMKNQIPRRIKESRKNKLLGAQKTISGEIHQALVGKTLDVMTEGRVPDPKGPGGYVYCGRSYRDCHEIDGLVFFHSEEEKLSGEFLRIQITEAYDYDLYGHILES